MKKYVVFGYEFIMGSHNRYFIYYVIAHNKMQAVRAFKGKFSRTPFMYLDYNVIEGYADEQCVIEYEEPIFHIV